MLQTYSRWLYSLRYNTSHKSLFIHVDLLCQFIPDMLAIHKLASQAKSQFIDLQVQVKSRVISLNFKAKSSQIKSKWPT